MECNKSKNFLIFIQKSYKKKSNKKANGVVQNGKSNGHLVKDLNQNDIVTKPSSPGKKHQ
jgi:hypothetical protein